MIEAVVFIEAHTHKTSRLSDNVLFEYFRRFRFHLRFERLLGSPEMFGTDRSEIRGFRRSNNTPRSVNAYI